MGRYRFVGVRPERARSSRSEQTTVEVDDNYRLLLTTGYEADTLVNDFYFCVLVSFLPFCLFCVWHSRGTGCQTNKNNGNSL